MSRRGKLSPRERAAVAALASGLSKTDAAASVGIRPETLSRYLRDPHVRDALVKAQDEAFSQLSRRMNANSNQMLDVLIGIAQSDDMPPSVRVRAALGWLDGAWKAWELLTLTRRVRSLEERVMDGVQA